MIIIRDDWIQRWRLDVGLSLQKTHFFYFVRARLFEPAEYKFSNIAIFEILCFVTPCAFVVKLRVRVFVRI